MKPAADLHNFGKRVVVHARRVVKPRPLLWEWAILSRTSPLRRALDEIGGGLFDFLPALRITPSRREVERIALAPLRPSAKSKKDLAPIVGRSLALWAWIGVSDLHWENLALGVDRRGRIVFGPLDVESMLSDMALPAETNLLAQASGDYDDVYRHAAGVRRVLPYLGKPLDASTLLSILSAYRTTLDLLDRHADELAAIIAALPALATTPIRVLLRATGDYARARSEPVWPPLLAAESEQLARGDVPYFFRLYGQRGIRFHRDARLETFGRIPLRGDVPRLAPLLDVARGLRSRSRRRLREEGWLSVVGAFDHPSLTGRHRDGDYELRLSARTIAIRFAGATLECRRDLRSVVGSAYLACRCGEVRTVLAHPRGACEADR